MAGRAARRLLNLARGRGVERDDVEDDGDGDGGGSDDGGVSDPACLP